MQDFGNNSGNEDGVAGLGGFGGGWDEDDDHGDMDEPFGENLVTAPRKVNFLQLGCRCMLLMHCNIRIYRFVKFLMT